MRLIRRVGPVLRVLMKNPVKQGLKQNLANSCILLTGSLNEESSKTRIETKKLYKH